MARSFNGTSDRITVGDVIDLAGLNTFTLFAWIYATSNSVQQRIISKWGASGVQYLFQMTSGGKLEIVAHDASGHQPLRDGTATVPTNTWSAVSALMQGPSPSDMFLGLNGVNTSVPGSGVTMTGGIQNTTQQLAFGDDAGAGATAPFHGRIAHAAIWNVALSDAELVMLANGALPTHVRPSALQGYWPLHGIDSPEPSVAGATRQAGTLTGTTFASGPPVGLGLINLRSGLALPQPASAPSFVSLPFISAATTVYSPSLAPSGAVELDLPFIPAATSVFAPDLTAPGEIDTPFIASATVVFSPALAASGATPVNLPFVSAATQVFSPVLVRVDTIPPKLKLIGATGDKLTLVYDEAIDPASGDSSDFTVTVNGSTDTVTGMTIAGSTVTLTVSTPISAGDTVKVTYVGTPTPITDLAANDAAEFTDLTAAVRIGGTYSLELWDWQTETHLCDLTAAATFTIKPFRSGQPLAVVAELAADNADIRTIWTDGRRYLSKIMRSLKVRKDGELIGHPMVWRIAYTGDENTSRCSITAYDPLKILKGRPYRDGTGNLINPDIASPISGGQIMKDAIANSISNSGPAGDQEGDLPLDATSGTFDTTIPPAVDLGIQLDDWPIMLDDVVTLLAETGAVDIWVTPVEGTPGIIGQLNVANRRGSDISDTVHFDWGLGDFSVAKVERADDAEQFQNKLYYYLGPKIDKEHWQGNITATELTPVDLSAYKTLQDDSRDTNGFTFMRIRTFDEDGANDARPLYHELWKEEVASSVDGREIVKITPKTGAPFQPFDDYLPGDTIAINISELCGEVLDGATQRIDSFEVGVGLDGVGTVSPLQTLQDG